jgi:hypothetical protein
MSYFRINSQYDEVGSNGWRIDWSKVSEKDMSKSNARHDIVDIKETAWEYLTGISDLNPETEFSGGTHRMKGKEKGKINVHVHRNKFRVVGIPDWRNMVFSVEFIGTKEEAMRRYPSLKSSYEYNLLLDNRDRVLSMIDMLDLIQDPVKRFSLRDKLYSELEVYNDALSTFNQTVESI